MCNLLEKARSLLVSDTPPFMRYTERSSPPGIKNWQDKAEDRLSGYRLWMYLNTVRFTISRLRELELAHIGITVEQSSILQVLLDMGTSGKLKDLEYATLRQHHSISTIINRMIKQNLVVQRKKTGGKELPGLNNSKWKDHSQSNDQYGNRNHVLRTTKLKNVIWRPAYLNYIRQLGICSAYQECLLPQPFLRNNDIISMANFRETTTEFAGISNYAVSESVNA